MAQCSQTLATMTPKEQSLALLRSALRQERFADVGGFTTELERAEAELSAVQELRRRLAGEHT